MKSNEIRTGNIVAVGNEIRMVETIGTNCDSLSPVPLNAKWMRRLGFAIGTAKIGKSQVTTWTNDSPNLVIEQESNTHFYWNTSGLSVDVNLKYVHELQNLYFALTGNELEIQNEQDDRED